METLLAYILVMKGVTLLAGGAIVYYTVQAALRTGDRGLWILAIGLIASGLGLLFDGILPMIVQIDHLVGIALTGTLAAIGLVFVVFSIASDVPVPR